MSGNKEIDDHCDDDHDVVIVMIITMITMMILYLGWPMHRRGRSDQMSVKLRHLVTVRDDTYDGDDNDDDDGDDNITDSGEKEEL